MAKSIEASSVGVVPLERGRAPLNKFQPKKKNQLAPVSSAASSDSG